MVGWRGSGMGIEVLEYAIAIVAGVGLGYLIGQVIYNEYIGF